MASKLLIPTTSSYSQVEMANALERLRLQNYLGVMENENHRQQAIIRRKILTMKDRYKVIRDRQIQLIEDTSKQIRSLEEKRTYIAKTHFRELEAKHPLNTLTGSTRGKQGQLDYLEDPHQPKNRRKESKNNRSANSGIVNDSKLVKGSDSIPWPLKRSNSVEEVEFSETHPEMLKLPTSAPKQRPQRDPIEQVAAENKLGQKEVQSKPRPFLTNLDDENSVVFVKSSREKPDRDSKSKKHKRDMKEKSEGRVSFPLLRAKIENPNKTKIGRAKTTVELSRDILSEILKDLPEYMTQEEKKNNAMEIFKKRKTSDEVKEMKMLDEKIKKYNEEIYSFTHPPQRSKWNRLKATVSIMRGFGLKLGNKNMPRGFAQRMGLRYR